MLQKNSDFAVIGMACRFPGASNYNEFWQNLILGKNCISQIPEERWKWQDYYGDPKKEVNKTNIKWGGFIKDIDKFDPMFFNISPKEAACIDPQHRLFLQTAWHAIEDAGYDIENLSGSKTGIYAGVSKNDYSELMRSSHQAIAPFISTGTVHSILVNRLSFLFDFHGRSEAVDTACSSGLVALHNAMRDIANGECEQALVGGVNALLAPTMFISHSKSGMLSVDGQCKTFDADANGYVRGEGVGVLMIKSLQKAEEAGDHIHAVIKSSAVNHGGRANFLTSPTVAAQSEVITAALEKADIDPATISYIEAHGTGTPMGDPIEINALKKAFKMLQAKSADSFKKQSAYCALSSVKTNIGHLESASGIAGIIKAILAMQHQKIPALANYKKLNPYIDIENSPFYIADKNIQWNALQYASEEKIPRRVGVSSFGMGGVNAHVILQEAPVRKTSAYKYSDHSSQLFLLSAKKNRLKVQAENLRDFLLTSDDIEQNTKLQDIAYTLQTGRVQFEERLALLASNKEELLQKLSQFIENDEPGHDGYYGYVKTKKGEMPESFKATRNMPSIELAEKWIIGAKLDWSAYYPGVSRPAKIPLPTYAFDYRRCWYDSENKSTGLKPVERPKQELKYEPALHMSETVFSRVLHTDDFFIQDHVVQGQKLLPGVAYLEIARAAYSQIASSKKINTITNTLWISPVCVKNEDLNISIKLNSDENDKANENHYTHFQISENGTLHSKGELGCTDLPVADFPAINIYDLKEKCHQQIKQQGLYQLFVQNGLNYGSSFQALQNCFYNDQEIVSELKIPEIVSDNFDDFVLHPSLMDGVFQTIVALSLLGLDHRDKQYVPYFLERVEIIKPIPAHCFAHASVSKENNSKKGEIKFDAVLCDAAGNILVKITGLTKRAILLQPLNNEQIEPNNKALSNNIIEDNMGYYRPVWQQQTVEQNDDDLAQLIVFGNDQDIVQQIKQISYFKGIVLLITRGHRFTVINENHFEIDSKDAEHYLQLIQYLKDHNHSVNHILYLWNFNTAEGENSDPFDDGIASILRLSKAIIAKRAYKNLKLLYLYSLEQQHRIPHHSMVAGFARTLIYESPKMRYLTVGIDQDNPQAVIEQILLEFKSDQFNKLHEVCYQNGKRLVRRVVEFNKQTELAQDIPSVLKQNGVYLISGGAGGLGFIFAKYLAKNYSATVLMLGRSKINPQIIEKIKAIEVLGGHCQYYSADITNKDELEHALSQIRQTYKSINGVIHGAGIIEDAYILLKQESSFAKVLATKVKGLLNLDAVTNNQKLDFFMMFSSIASLMPNQGQSDYAAANSFLDYFAALRNNLSKNKQRYGVNLAINWPLWAQGGMQVTAEEEAHLQKEFGMKPLPENKGLIIFEQSLKLAARHSLSDGLSQLVAIEGNKEKIAACLGITDFGFNGPVISDPIFSDTNINSTKKLHVQLATNNTDYEEQIMEGVSKDKIESEIKQLFADQFDIAFDKIDGTFNISEFGLDSASVLLIIQQINKKFQLDLKPTLFFEINTINQLIDHINENCVAPYNQSKHRHNNSLIDGALSDFSTMQFERKFSTSEFYLKDHVVEEQYNMPGACYIEMARQAGELVFGNHSVIKLMNNYWVSKLSSPDKDFSAYLNIIAKQENYEYEIFSFAENRDKKIHAVGQLLCANNDQQTTEQTYCDLSAIRNRCHSTQYPDQIYQQIIAEGLHVGETFMPMEQILLNDHEALATLKLPESIKDTVNDYVLHPTMLTGVFQTALISNRNDNDSPDHYIPISIDELEIMAPVTDQCFIYSKAQKNKANIRKFDLLVCREDGLVAVKLTGFTIRALKQSLNEKPIQPTTMTVSSAAVDGKDPADLVTATQHFIKTLLSEPVGLSTDEIDKDEPFEVYGINSVMIVELNKSFEDVFGPLSKTLFFEYRNIEELTEFFIEHYPEKLQQLLQVNSTTETEANPEQPVSNNETVQIEQTEQVLTSAIINSDSLTMATRQFIKNLLADPIGLSADEIDEEENFEVYGINSVMIVELNKSFEDVFGPLSKTLFFEYRNVAELAEYFIENHADKLSHKVDVNIDEQPTINKDETHQQKATIEQKTTDQKNNAVKVDHTPDRHDALTEENEIAIIGVDGRYPGANNIEQFWDVLKQGQDCVTEIPESHFEYSRYYNDDPEQNKIYSKKGGFINDVDKFDPAFFNISPREAELIDPQERLFLQVTWGMLEDAGYTSQSLLETSNRQVGVFVGALWQPYQALGTEETSKGNVVAPSGLLYSIANRVSYYLNLSGPSLAIDTACSSSLTAIHMACQSILSGDCKMAIAGGVNLSLHSSKYLFLSQNRFLSTDGRCQSFGEGGNGYVPGEGVGAVLLKSLSAAKKDGDRIYAVIKGSAVNHGGKTHGYTVPSPNAQADLIRQAHHKAKIDPRTISYIEAHGTGTALGDPIEISGLDKAFNVSTQDKQFCAIGSVKSNIGHLEAAAGIASITKVILQMKHKQLTPSIHSDRLNPNIEFKQTSFKVQRELSDWHQPLIEVNGVNESITRRAGISSFGAGGANAHLILEEYDNSTAYKNIRVASDIPVMVVLSAKNEQRLIEKSRNLYQYLTDQSDPVPLINMAYTLQAGREMMDQRLGMLVHSVEQLKQKLNAFLNKDKNIDDLYVGNINQNKDTLALFKGDEDMLKVIEVMISKGKYKKLLDLWVKGFNINWNLFYGEGKPEKISLPTYPFAKERYWIPEGINRGNTHSENNTVLHPLVHQNSSSLTQQRFTSVFTGEEFFLNHHIVGETKVLPAVAYIEMLRAAADFSNDQPMPCKLVNLTWLKPLSVEQQPEKVIIEISVEEDEIFVQVGRESNGVNLAHAEGQLHYLDSDEQTKRLSSDNLLDPNLLERNLQQHAESEEIYRLFHQKSLNLQKGFQGLNWIKWNNDQALGFITLPTFLNEHNRTDYAVHPCLLDSALQTALYLLEREHQQQGALYLPFSIAEVEFFADLPDTLYSSVTPSDGKPMADSESKVRSYDVTLLDVHGEILLKVKNICFRKTDLSDGTIHSSEVNQNKEKSNISYSTPDWVDAPVAVDQQVSLHDADIILVTNNEKLLNDFNAKLVSLSEEVSVIEVAIVDNYPKPAPGRIYINSTDEDDYQQLKSYLNAKQFDVSHIIYLWDSSLDNDTHSIADQTQIALTSLFYLDKVLLDITRPIKQLFVNLIAEASSSRAIEGGINGFLNSVSCEYPKLSNRVISIESNHQTWMQHVFDELLVSNKNTNEWIRYQQNSQDNTSARRGWQLQDITMNPDLTLDYSVFKQGGTYLISGGMGGIAKVLSRYLVKNYNANLILLGRSSLDSKSEGYLASLNTTETKVVYLQVDICNLPDLEQQIATIKQRYRSIEGVIHTAGVLDDNLLANKTVNSLLAVAEPKMQGTYNLDQVTQSESLDFFVVFSSLTSVLGNPGQADYGAANGFMDAFINERATKVTDHQRNGLSLSINWPFWSEGDMGQDADVLSMLDESFGSALDNEEGIHCFERVFHLQQNQIAVIKKQNQKTETVIENIHYNKSLDEGLLFDDSSDSDQSVSPTTTSDFLNNLNHDIKLIIAELGKFRVDQILPDSDFIALGLDSVILAKLAIKLNKKYALKISPAIFFEYTNLAKLNTHLMDEYDSTLAAYYQSHQSKKLRDADNNQEKKASTADHGIIHQQRGKTRLTSQIRSFKPDGLKMEKSKSQKKDVKQQSTTTDIAVIGMDCLFPGAADLESFWQLLINRESAVSEVPADRWDWQTYYGDPGSETNKTNIKWGGFVEDLDKFDASFFNISPREAALMDPQQRILLQSVWKGIENAGYAPKDLANKNKVGFFVGASTNDYYELLANNDVEAYSSTGGTHSITANRVSYLFDFKGPSIAVDTACSSSLIALDMAVKSLQDGRCDVAIAGGVNALITPTLYLSFSKAGMLSPDGNISPLDEKANGYVRGEGAGIVVLKRLDKAELDNDEILAVIKGTSVNHGGKVSSLTVPSPKAQSELIVDACENAKVDVSTLNFIEMHGTGTPLGDPIEVNGLKTAFKTGKVIDRQGYCGISSVKGNIGHLEAAAGIASVIKTILALKHKKLPGLCNFNSLNPHIQLENSPFKVVNELEDWESLKDNKGQKLPRRAGVSSFGFGGANSHVVIEEYKASKPGQNKSKQNHQKDKINPSLIVLSAMTEDRLKAVANNIHHFLINSNMDIDDLEGIAYTLQVGRVAMNERLALLVYTQEELLLKLNAYIRGEENIDNLYRGQVHNVNDSLSPTQNYDQQTDEWVNSGEYNQLLASWVVGFKVDWSKLYKENMPKRLSLPAYPFAKERHWISNVKSQVTSNEAVKTADIDLESEDQSATEKLSTKLVDTEILRDKSICYFKTMAASTLQMPVEKIDSTRSLEQYGMDSILVMQLVNSLHHSFPGINSTVLFEYRTVEALVDYFIETQAERLIKVIESQNNSIDQTSKMVNPKSTMIVENDLVNTGGEAISPSIRQIADEVSNNKVDFKEALRMVKGSEMEEVQ